MAKIKTTFNAKVNQVTFGPAGSGEPTLTVERDMTFTSLDGESFTQPDYLSLPVDPKRLAKLLGVTDVEITVTVTPKGAKKARKSKKAAAQTVVTTATTEPSAS
jgi:hypothetical protein